MVAIKNVLLFVTAASALSLPFAKRATATTILTDIATLDKDVKALTSAANAYTGGISAALNVQNAEQQVDKDIVQAGKDANATTSVSSADATKISNAITNLTTDIETAIKAVENKKAQFAADGLTNTVQNDLKQLQTDSDSFANRLITLAPSSLKSKAQSQKAKIDSDFAAAIKFFAS